MLCVQDDSLPEDNQACRHEEEIGVQVAIAAGGKGGKGSKGGKGNEAANHDINVSRKKGHGKTNSKPKERKKKV